RYRCQVAPDFEHFQKDSPEKTPTREVSTSQSVKFARRESHLIENKLLDAQLTVINYDIFAGVLSSKESF
ncbi:MAG TPA: hypothetical protein VH593_07325, partial [Ktedonobacteraceae bacterium]